MHLNQKPDHRTQPAPRHLPGNARPSDYGGRKRGHNYQSASCPKHKVTDTSYSNYAGSSYLNSELDVDYLVPPEAITNSAQAQFMINFTTPETYTVWLRGYAPNTLGDSVYVGQTPTNSALVTGFAPQSWSWAKSPLTLTIGSSGLYSLNLWLREDGLRIDRLLLTTDTIYIPAAYGPPESKQLTDTMLRARIFGNKMADWMKIKENKKETRAGSLFYLWCPISTCLAAKQSVNRVDH